MRGWSALRRRCRVARARGIEDFNGDGQVDFDDYTWALANAGLDARSPFQRAADAAQIENE